MLTRWCPLDTELARTYELEIDAQYLPLGVYTQDVDYPDVSVQVPYVNQKIKLPWKYLLRLGSATINTDNTTANTHSPDPCSFPSCTGRMGVLDLQRVLQFQQPVASRTWPHGPEHIMVFTDPATIVVRPGPSIYDETFNRVRHCTICPGLSRYRTSGTNPGNGGGSGRADVHRGPAGVVAGIVCDVGCQQHGLQVPTIVHRLFVKGR